MKSYLVLTTFIYCFNVAFSLYYIDYTDVCSSVEDSRMITLCNDVSLYDNFTDVSFYDYSQELNKDYVGLFRDLFNSISQKSLIIINDGEVSIRDFIIIV